jgi:hypothetical protein
MEYWSHNSYSRYPQELRVFNLDKEDTKGGMKGGGDRQICRGIG